MKGSAFFQHTRFYSFTVVFFCCVSYRVCAQDTLQIRKETSYYRTYFQNVIGRIYTARKYTTLTMRSTDHTANFKYVPNTNFGLGVGVTYRALTINLGYGFGFLFNDKNRGKTHALDLQTRLYASKWAIDGYAKSYRGYYLSSQETTVPGNSKPSDFYVRPDMKLRLFGASAYRMFNGKGFSLRPAFVQDVKQKKSGGSFLAGGEWFYINVKVDSALVPNLYASSDYKKFSSMNMLQIGPGAGYAYTQVFPHNFFATGYLTTNLNVSLLHEAKASGISFRTGLNTNLLYRLAVGYDNGDCSIVAYILNNRIGFKGTAYDYTVNTGNARLMIAKRFKTTRTMKKYMSIFNILVD